MTQAAFDGARTARGQKADVETAHLKRIVFDEGHHLFDAADSAFSAVPVRRRGGRDAPLDPRAGRAAAGAGGGWRRGCASWSAEREDAREALSRGDPRRRRAARRGLVRPHRAADRRGQPDRADRGLPGRGAGAAARPRRAAPNSGMECAARPALDLVRETAAAAARALAADRGAAAGAGAAAGRRAGRGGRRPGHRRPGPDRRRAARPRPPRADDAAGLALDAEGASTRTPRTIPTSSTGSTPTSCTAGWSTPPAAATGSTRPSRWHAAVLAPAHGVLVTSATLADSTLDDPFALAEMRTGAARFAEPARRRCGWPRRSTTPPTPGPSWSPTSAATTPRQVAAAMRELFLAAGGGGARPVHRHPPPARRARAHRRAAGRRGPGPLRPARRPAGGRRAGRHLPRRGGRLPARAPTRCATASTCPAARCACWSSTACPGRGPDLLHKARRDALRRQGLRRRHRPRPHRPGVRPPDPPRRRQGRLRHARRRRADPPVLQPARGRDAGADGPGRGDRGGGRAPGRGRANWLRPQPCAAEERSAYAGATSRPMAQRNAAISRAIAATTTGSFLPAAARRR